MFSKAGYCLKNRHQPNRETTRKTSEQAFKGSSKEIVGGIN
jgi:hypothetical protein